MGGFDGIRLSNIAKIKMAGDLLLSEKVGTQTFWYRYDSGANLISISTKGNMYFYVRNAQNDIIGLIDGDGNTVVKYQYDSWGRLISITGSLADTIGVQNPFRYRGYYYDNETGMYYLKSRYYDPEIRRFLSADDMEVLTVEQGNVHQYNLYAYCLKSPVNRLDEDGNFSLPNWAKVAIGVAAIAVGTIATVAVAATWGAATVALVASLKIAAVSSAIGTVSGASISAVNSYLSGNDWKGVGKAAVSGAINGACDGFMWGGLTAGVSFTIAAKNGIRVKEIGKLKPSNKSGDGYPGIKYEARKANGRYTTQSIELHSPHGTGGHDVWHWQKNKWNPYNNSITGSAKRWHIYGTRL